MMLAREQGPGHSDREIRDRGGRAIRPETDVADEARTRAMV